MCEVARWLADFQGSRFATHRILSIMGRGVNSPLAAVASLFSAGRVNPLAARVRGDPPQLS